MKPICCILAVLAFLAGMASSSAYADNPRVKAFGKADVTFGYYDQIRNEYNVIKNYMPGTTLYWGGG